MDSGGGTGDGSQGGSLKKPTLNYSKSVPTSTPRSPPHVRPTNTAPTSPIPTMGSLSSPPGSVQRPRGHRGAPSIDMNAMLSSGAHELEAETQILRAVEKMTGQAHRRAATDTKNLFATIAEDEITRAMNEGELFDKKPAAPISNEAEANKASDAMSMSSTSKLSAKTKFKSLVQAVLADTNAKETTVEQSLFGLSSALTKMDKSARNRNMSVLGTYDGPLKSADKLATKIDEHLHEDMSSTGDVEEGGMVHNNNEETKTTSPNYTDSDLSGVEDNEEVAGKKKKKRIRGKKRNAARKVAVKAAGGLKEDFELFNEFLEGKKKGALYYARTVLFFIMGPSMALACLFFYVVKDHEDETYERYPTGYPMDGQIIPGQDASVSWWLLYIGCRLPLTLTMALITQAFVIDFVALGSRLALSRILRPIITLLIVQSKGWPFVSTFWGTYNLILLSGDERYVRHWLYFQDYVGLFNEENPGGNVIDSALNKKVWALLITVGILVSIKRLVVGLMLGRQTFASFGTELATVMKNMVLVGAVATLAREIEKDSKFYEALATRNPEMARSQSLGWADTNAISDFVDRETDAIKEQEEEEAKLAAKGPTAADAAVTFVQKEKKSKKNDVPQSPPKQAEADATQSGSAPGPNGTPPQVVNTAEGGFENTSVTAPDGEFTLSETMAISEMLDAWEEPARPEESEERKITIGAIMQFRQALTFMKRKYPFLPAFGPADSRERCLESSQAVYDRLIMRTPHHNTLPFETLAILAKDDQGGINQEKAKELIKLFRPERDGSISKMDFVKSIDNVYKRLRLLSANISNSSQIDRAIESCVNVAFYIIVGCYVLSAIGENPRAIFFSFSSVILGFAFMFGATSAKYFEGILFILVQRPYGVGDRIHLSNPQNETSPEGSSGWIVEKVTLTTTTVYWGATNERATLNNGAIANLRVINAARSPNATVFVELRFAIDTPYDKIAIFRAAVEQYLKDRPREWLTFVGFRPTEVAVDRGFIGYKVIAQHRNHWQGVGGILESKSALTTYCLEVAKQLEMRYHAPPLPVDLSLKGTAASALRALQPGASTRTLDSTKIDAALAANRARRGGHEAFADE